MRHWAILAVTAVTVAAMAVGTELDQLTPFYGIIVAIIVGDKALSWKKPKP